MSGLPTYIPTAITAPVESRVGVGVELMAKNMQPDVASAWNFGVQQKTSTSRALAMIVLGVDLLATQYAVLLSSEGIVGDPTGTPDSGPMNQ